MHQDPEAIRQKGSRLAQLAVRRHQRQIKAPDRADRLARSNAVVMRRAAQSLIRGHGKEVDSGWAEAPWEAAVLCFDEVQITDPFTAVALKGTIIIWLLWGRLTTWLQLSLGWDMAQEFRKRILHVETHITGI